MVFVYSGQTLGKRFGKIELQRDDELSGFVDISYLPPLLELNRRPPLGEARASAVRRLEDQLSGPVYIAVLFIDLYGVQVHAIVHLNRLAIPGDQRFVILRNGRNGGSIGRSGGVLGLVFRLVFGLVCGSPTFVWCRLFVLRSSVPAARAEQRKREDNDCRFTHEESPRKTPLVCGE